MRRFLIVVLIGLMLAPVAQASIRHDKKVYGEVRPDKALVYLVRQRAMLGGGVGMFVFADDQFLAFLKNNTYSFAYVEPGRHLIWIDWLGNPREIEFVPGQTYYFDIAPAAMAVVSEEEGKKLVEQSSAYMEAQEIDFKNAEGKIKKRYARAQKIEGKKGKAEIEEVAAVAPPESTEGMLRVPAYTPLKLQLRETVSSAMNKTGETVWLLVAEDAAVDGQTFVRKGTPVKATIRQAKSGASYGMEGMLDIAIPAVTGVDGNAIPVVGQIATAGQGRTGAPMAGLLVGAMIKGTESYRLAGSELAVWTRQEAWVKPAEASAEPEAATDADVMILKAFTLSSPPRFAADGRRRPDPIELTVQTDGEIKSAEIYRVGDWPLPSVVAAMRTARNPNGAAVVFGGWDLARYLTPGQEVVVAVRGKLADDKAFTAEVPIKLIVEE